MTNIYGIEPESAGWLEQESPMPNCPKCASDVEVYITTETFEAIEYTCAYCGIKFYISDAIPF